MQTEKKSADGERVGSTDGLGPKYGEKFRNKKTGRLAFVLTEPSSPTGIARLQYERTKLGKRGRRIWVYPRELLVKFEKVQRKINRQRSRPG